MAIVDYCYVHLIHFGHYFVVSNDQCNNNEPSFHLREKKKEDENGFDLDKIINRYSSEVLEL